MPGGRKVCPGVLCSPISDVTWRTGRRHWGARWSILFLSSQTARLEMITNSHRRSSAELSPDTLQDYASLLPSIGLHTQCLHCMVLQDSSKPNATGQWTKDRGKMRELTALSTKQCSIDRDNRPTVPEADPLLQGSSPLANFRGLSQPSGCHCSCRHRPMKSRKRWVVVSRAGRWSQIQTVAHRNVYGAQSSPGPVAA